VRLGRDKANPYELYRSSYVDTRQPGNPRWRRTDNRRAGPTTPRSTAVSGFMSRR